MRTVALALLILIAPILHPVSVAAQDHCPINDPIESQIKRETPALEARRDCIKTELATIKQREDLPDDHWSREWAGDYYTGDGLGMNVMIHIAPENGVTYTWTGCLGLYDANHGDIVETFPNGVRLALAIPVRGDCFDFISERLYFVRWGDERYLVPESQMLKLVNNFNKGGYARQSMFNIPRLVRNNEFHRRAETPPGLPELPEKYATLLRTERVVLTVTSLTEHPVRRVTGDVHVYEYDLVLSGGADKAVFKGMEFRINANDATGTLRITEVSDDSSQGKATFYTSGNHQRDLIKIGQSISNNNP